MISSTPNLNLPEFIEPKTTGDIKKPEPIAGLAEYLRSQLANTISKDTKILAVHSAQELSRDISEGDIVWIDLEINPKNQQLINGAMLVNNSYWLFDAKKMANNANDIFELLEQATFLGGHNLIEFDLPRLIDLLIKTDSLSHENSAKLSHGKPEFLNKWQQKTWDTLLLSCLFIPHQPSHALAKLYKANVSYNDPVQDCLESRCVFELCLQAWQHIPSVLHKLFYNLLPAFKTLTKLSSQFFVINRSADDTPHKIEEICTYLPQGNTEELNILLVNKMQACKQNADTQWQNLGLVCFVNWLRYFDKPQARRPVWIIKHHIFRHGFIEAEQTFWHIDKPSETAINQEAKDFFGFDELRLGQMSIVKAILDNKDIPLGILPTGGGKSLTFQLPALILSRYKRQLSVIICPLKALIEDQVANLHSHFEQHSELHSYKHRIACLTSNQEPAEQQQIITGIWQGDIDIIYMSPERLRSNSIRQLLRNRPPAFWVLDEAHTLSQWGTDFRPDFLRIADHIMACYDSKSTAHIQKNLAKLVNKQSDQLDLLAPQQETETQVQTDDEESQYEFIAPKIGLVTATASAKVKTDLTAELVNKLSALTDNKPLMQYGIKTSELKIWRDEIQTFFEKIAKDERKAKIYKILATRQQWYRESYPEHTEKGVALVYVRSRKLCEEFAEDFSKQGLMARAYHSQKEDKQQTLEAFKNHELEVVVCTNAFGMGIDKEGIHTVIHHSPPNNLESYIQEIGRVARKDYEKTSQFGQAYMLWSEEDIEFLFLQERNSRIPNSRTLNDCWTAIKPVLNKSITDQWFSSSLLSPILQVDDIEQLNTQIRVALLALERYGLLIEKDQQPAYISIKLLDKQPSSEKMPLLKLYQQIQQISVGALEHGVHNVTLNDNNDDHRYHLPELALVLGYSVKSLLMALRALVKGEHALWQVTIKVRKPLNKQNKPYRHATLQQNFNTYQQVISVMQTCIENTDIQLNNDDAMDGFVRMDTQQLDNWLQQNRHGFKASKVLTTLHILDIIKTRRSGNGTFVSASSMTKQWLAENNKVDEWQSWLCLAMLKLEQLQVLQSLVLDSFNDNSNDADNSQEFDVEKLAEDFTQRLQEYLSSNNTSTTYAEELQTAMTEDISADDVLGTNMYRVINDAFTVAMEKIYPNITGQKTVSQSIVIDANEVLNQLQQLKKIGAFEISRLDDANDAIFFVGNNQKSSRYGETAYKELKQYYQIRCMRIHLLYHWLQAEHHDQKTIIEDYFKLPLHEVADTYLTIADPSRPYIKDYKQAILPDYFSDVQKQIVQETSRASMVLAGAGSGKTTVVVHRIAYLLIEEEIKPEKILVLAYNRLAVFELKIRLQKLVGHHANGVTIKTFHGLAREITELSEKDAPTESLHQIKQDVTRIKTDDEARYHWIIQEATRQAEEKSLYYQYIMVDEFQDIDQYQYQLIGQLANFDKEELLLEPENIQIDNSSNDKEQSGYLMVVGDDDQNLYAFRGASIKYIQQFEQEYQLETGKKYYLLANYRSAKNIVNLANAFIEKALTPSERLKDNNNRVQPTDKTTDSSTIRFGTYCQKKGIDMACWLVTDIQNKLTKNPQANIAILAPQWQCFDSVQHYLEQANINSQRFNESDGIAPINSMIGQYLKQHLSTNNLQLITDNVTDYLEEWRQQQHLNHLDMAWIAILHAVAGMHDCTYEKALHAIEKAQYGEDALVSLVTYHSAKGLEFDHVYVLDESNSKNQSESIRPLYVALTRAKNTLTILQQEKNHNIVLSNILKDNTIQQEQLLESFIIPRVPTIEMPEQLVFHKLLDLKEIILTPKSLVSDSGREFIEHTFSRDSWTQSRLAFPKSAFNMINASKNPKYSKYQFCSTKGQTIVELSQNYNDKNKMQLVGYTTYLYHQTNLEWYQGKYKGIETSHYLIVPFVRVCVAV